MAIVSNSLKSFPARVPQPPILSPRGNWPWSAFQAFLAELGEEGIVLSEVPDTERYINLALFLQDYPVILTASLYSLSTILQPSSINTSCQVACTPMLAPGASALTCGTVSESERALFTIDGISGIPGFIGVFKVNEAGGLYMCVTCISLSPVVLGPQNYGIALDSSTPGPLARPILLRASDYAAVTESEFFDATTFRYVDDGQAYTVVGAYEVVVGV